MPPTSVHFNGGVNLADAESVMREIATRVPVGVRRIPDARRDPVNSGSSSNSRSSGRRRGWSRPRPTDQLAPGYEQMPKVRLADSAEPDDVRWPNLGYADAYLESFETFQRLRDEGVIPSGVRFQVEYPTPLASINGWVVREDQDRLEPSYERALFADLDRLVAAIPHDDLAVQWDVAVEFAILEGGFEATEAQTFDHVVDRLARCIERVPADVPAGLHRRYGDYKHQHFEKQPESLEPQVRFQCRVIAHSRPGRTGLLSPSPRTDATSRSSSR